jgi:DNA processing protein
MSKVTGASAQQAASWACRECRRRGWLLGSLSRRLDYQSSDETRLLDLLELDDEQLIEAIGGRRRRELRDQWKRFDAERDAKSDTYTPPDANAGNDLGTGENVSAGGTGSSGGQRTIRASVQTVCRHVGGYPRGLREHRGAPAMLYVLGGGAERLARLTDKPAVAIVGSVRPTDYGMEMARTLARGLSASGMTIVSGFANGIAAAAHDGALQAGGATVTVMAGGVDVVTPAGRRGLYERVIQRGCAVSERPCGFAGRRWGEPARARTIAAMAQLTIVVEAGRSPAELRSARVACRLGRSVVAVPGRVTSPASVGTNLLLMAGAAPVRGPEDAIEALHRATCPVPRAANPAATRAPSPVVCPHWPEVEALLARDHGTSRTSGLEPRLLRVLEQVGAGRDTPGRLAAAGADPAEAMLALSELELLGLLGRGDGGRYVPRESLAG